VAQHVRTDGNPGCPGADWAHERRVALRVMWSSTCAARTCAKVSGVDDEAQKAVLHRSLRAVREGMLWKLDGLSERDVRRPMVPTGTNLLGLVKHLACVEYAYFGTAFDRPPPEPVPWWDDDANPNDDMWATADESREQVLALYGRACGHADRTIDQLGLDTVGHVFWWPEDRRTPTLHTLLVVVVAETNRHAGHADILRELIDGRVGLRAGHTNMPPGEAEWWQTYRQHLDDLAARFD
jgi:hypothetical protein